MLIVQLVRVKRGESARFRIDSGVRQGCIMSPWLFNVYMDGVMEVKMGMHVDPVVVRGSDNIINRNIIIGAQEVWV